MRSFYLKCGVFFLVFTIVLSGCKKEDSGWDSDLLSPLMKTRLDFTNFINDTLLYSDENGMLSLRFKSVFELIPLDSLLLLPDTTIVNELSLPISINIPPGFSIISENQELNYSLGDIRITEVRIDEGTCNIRVKSIVPRNLIFNYSVPKATFNGQSIVLSNQLLNAFNGDTVIFNELFNLAMYNFNLTGDQNNSFNRLRLIIDAKIANDQQAYQTVANQVFLKIENTFSGIKPYFARGYFGQRTFSNQSSTNVVEALRNIEGIIALDQVNLNLSVRNGLGVDLRFRLNEVSAINNRNNTQVALNHSIIGQNINMTRALNQPDPFSGTPFIASSSTYQLNNSNSNLKSLFENLPDQIRFNVDASVNPLGNISNGNDFLYKSSNVNLQMDLDIPLKFSASELSLTDTLDFKVDNQQNLNRLRKGNLILIADNQFPVELIPELILLNDEGAMLTRLNAANTIQAATVDNNFIASIPLRSVLKFNIPSEKLAFIKDTKRVVVKVKMNTQPGNVLLPIYNTYFIDLKLAADFTYLLQP